MSAPVRTGDVLAGKYRVDRVLGEGGMGVVVAARHLQLDQIVALKFLLPEAVANPEALDRFAREARNAVRLRSEHVARIIDVGTLDGSAPYIVMEFLEGSDLAGVLAQQRVLPIPVAVDVVLQACDAIAEAHALGIIHRDLKPQNLFVTQRHDGTSLVKVLDFGISKSVAGGSFVATRSQAVMGSPAYMSPEQMRSSKFVDARTDIWALGVILYQLVVGQLPWEAESFTELCFKVATEPLPALPRPQPAGFEDVVRRCLEKDPNRRFGDVHALAASLMPFAPAHAQPLVDSIGRVLRGRASGGELVPATAVVGSGTFREAAGQRMIRTAMDWRRRRAIGLAAMVGALVGIVLVAVALGGGRGGEPASGAVAPAPAGHTIVRPVPVASSPPTVAPPPPIARPPAPEAAPPASRPGDPIAPAPVSAAAPPNKGGLTSKFESPSKLEPRNKAESPSKVEPPSKLGPPSTLVSRNKAEPPIKAEPPDKAEPSSKTGSPSTLASRNKAEPPIKAEPPGKVEPSSQAASSSQAELSRARSPGGEPPRASGTAAKLRDPEPRRPSSATPIRPSPTKPAAPDPLSSPD